MILSDLEDIKEMEVTYAVYTAEKNVTKRKSAVDTGDTSRKSTVAPKNVSASTGEATGIEPMPDQFNSM
jgi:hypothetical protein